MNNLKTVSIKLPASTWKKAKILSAEFECTLQEIVTAAINQKHADWEYKKKNPRPIRD